MKNFPLIIFIKSVLSLLFAIIMVGEVFSFQQSSQIVASASRLWFEGSSNVNQFECDAENYSGEALLPGYQEQAEFIDHVTEILSSVKLEIEVDSIECGQRKMNKDLQKALKAETFPEITFNFMEAELINPPQSYQDAFDVEVHGELTVAGNTREIRFMTEAYFINDERFRATGQTTIKMTDFGVEPPTALMGLIRADDELTVHFDLVAIENKN